MLILLQFLFSPTGCWMNYKAAPYEDNLPEDAVKVGITCCKLENAFFQPLTISQVSVSLTVTTVLPIFRNSYSFFLFSLHFFPHAQSHMRPLAITIKILKRMREITRTYANTKDLTRFGKYAYILRSRVIISISYS